MDGLSTGMGTGSFSRGPRFERPVEAPTREHEAVVADVRANIETAGEYLVWTEGSETKVMPLGREWTRIGRSLAADIHFDDPTVSRRHALLVRQADGVRVLDDRSLNGVFVNGDRVEWRTLADGDEILVGRYHLRFLAVTEEDVAVTGRRTDTAGG